VKLDTLLDLAVMLEMPRRPFCVGGLVKMSSDIRVEIEITLGLEVSDRAANADHPTKIPCPGTAVLRPARSCHRTNPLMSSNEEAACGSLGADGSPTVFPSTR
jgi:hypothetical protein